MYLHIGSDAVLDSSDIIGIFDLDNASRSRRTRDFLNAAQRAGRVSTVGDDLPKSFVLCGTHEDFRVILTQIASSTILKRAEQALKYEGESPLHAPGQPAP